MITQKDIAERAGVSRATVSRAFTRHATVHPETLRRIRDAIYDLGGEMPPWLPQGRTGGSNYVMILAGDISNEFYSKIIKGCCNSLSKQGLYAVVCDSSYNIGQEKNWIRYAVREKFCGIILITAVENPELVELLRSVRIPVVLANRYIRSLDMNMVCIDNNNGSYIATHYLIQHGHRDIAFLGGFENSTATQDRYKGYTAALTDAGLPVLPSRVYFSGQTIEDGREIAAETVKRGLDFTAIFATSCPLAVGAVNCFASLGYKVPDQLSIICFDDSPSIGEDGLNLSTMSCEPYLIGQETAAALLHALDETSSGKTTLLLSPRLIERASVRTLDARETLEPLTQT